jgi:hypothetical protein
MPHPDHHARRAAQSARSLAKLATVAGGNGRRTALLGIRATVVDTTTAPCVVSAPAAGESPDPREPAQAIAARAWQAPRG